VICPFCAHNDDKVIDSRASDAGKVIRRRRECIKCERRFTTYERVEELSRLTVIKRDGTRVPFNHDNILRGIQYACGKRPISEDAKAKMVTDIEEQLYREYDREVPSQSIGQMVCQKLRDTDEIAYIRFASEYYRFETAGELVEELQGLKGHVRDTKDQAKLF